MLGYFIFSTYKNASPDDFKIKVWHEWFYAIVISPVIFVGALIKSLFKYPFQGILYLMYGTATCLSVIGLIIDLQFPFSLSRLVSIICVMINSYFLFQHDHQRNDILNGK